MAFDLHPINQLNAIGAPDFVTLEAVTLISQAVAHFEAHTGRTLAPSQVEMHLIETISYMLTLRGSQEQLAFENAFVAYAQPNWLERHGAGRNTFRLEAKPATTQLRFESDAPVITRIRIPLNTRVSDGSGSTMFLTQGVVYIEAGEISVTVDAIAADPGVNSNGFAIGTLNALVDPIVGVSNVSNISETGGGADRENNARLRARIALASERISRGGHKEGYAALVYDWNADVLDVEPLRPEPGYIHLHLLMNDGTLNDEEKASLLVYLEGKIPMGDFVSAFLAIAHSFDVKLKLVVTDPDAVQEAEAAVAAVLSNWKSALGGYLAPSELIRVAKAVPGVVEADVQELTLTKIPSYAWRNGTLLPIDVELV